MERIINYKMMEIYFIKKKNEAFTEVENRKKKHKEVDLTLLQKKETFLNYININRIKSVFSKEGEIESIKEIGKYIKLVLEDARNDFMLDYPEVKTYNENDIKFITGSSNFKLVELIKSFL